MTIFEEDPGLDLIASQSEGLTLPELVYVSKLDRDHYHDLRFRLLADHASIPAGEVGSLSFNKKFLIFYCDPRCYGATFSLTRKKFPLEVVFVCPSLPWYVSRGDLQNITGSTQTVRPITVIDTASPMPEIRPAFVEPYQLSFYP